MIRLTQYSHGTGCGCKISPEVLETIPQSELMAFHDPQTSGSLLLAVRPEAVADFHPLSESLSLLVSAISELVPAQAGVPLINVLS